MPGLRWMLEHRPRRLLAALGWGVLPALVGAACINVALVSDLEDSLGLHWLFTLRGPMSCVPAGGVGLTFSVVLASRAGTFHSTSKVSVGGLVMKSPLPLIRPVTTDGPVLTSFRRSMVRSAALAGMSAGPIRALIVRMTPV